MNISASCMTFDKLLWYKALGIIAKKKLNMICFHILMSFLDAVWDLMSGSGIEEV